MTSPGLLRYQWPMLVLACKIVWRGIRPGSGPQRALCDIAPIRRVVAAPTAQLVDSYRDWCGAGERYVDTLPPHMVAHWGLPVATELVLQTPFPVSKVLNQGVTVTIHGDLPRHQPLVCTGAVQDVVEKDDRVRMSVLLQTGTAATPVLVETSLHMVIIRHRSKAAGAKKQSTVGSDEIWDTTGAWRATSHDGLQFALLTGDFNPIHWLPLAGRLSALRGKILHGFGTFARCFELLGGDRIRHIDVRFLRPVPLPSAHLLVQQAERPAGAARPIRLTDDNAQVYLTGSVGWAPREPANL